ncbi:hypothetical protein HUX88_24625 [Duganella sp. BJB1802]|uniref:hypothetical protein n=1 Tax=Duganella sp. BJB1802 TaxID=2744575 RepID=UPI001594747A|nr:hypothetical protein [Duganella sp. BJB1802]NVD73699.1 hypothetical protein [Duganella sp. BJB1802]
MRLTASVLYHGPLEQVDDIVGTALALLGPPAKQIELLPGPTSDSSHRVLVPPQQCGGIFWTLFEN